MKEFLAHHSYLIVWILALIIVGSIAILILQLNGITTGPLVRPATPTPSIPSAPAKPAAPNVTLTIVKSSAGNSLVVQWQNLPSNATKLDIFRSKNASTTVWSLWKTILLTPGGLANGSASIDLGSSLMDGYLFYVQVGSDDDNPIWVSSSSMPIVTTSTPPMPPPDSGNPPPPPPPPPDNNLPGNPTSTPPAPPENPSSTAPNPPSGGGTPSSTPSSTPPSTPPGDPFYNPQVQITGYGTAPGDFWVQHSNQSIQIGWQNIPAGIDAITVARSASSTGPWNTIITQHNPGTSGSYSLQLVDNSLNDPYYYQMTAFTGTTTVATYGPVLLQPN